ncbi:MAG: hypothetical protein E4H14_10780 [Candidatus Thorarchaeota archaeon]|nr:MAG: hypothetical protein E4H14_10780 [Candidatus Thorarchaeota archaeon]
MKLNYKHAFVIFAMAFLFASPAIAAANAGSAVVAQDMGEDFIFQLLENGAEVVFASVDSQGAPTVVYGQLGIPSETLGLTQTGPGQMYEGCVAMALVATQGELLNYILDLVGGSFLNFSGEEGAMNAAQFGEGGFDINSILDMIGTDFSLLINIFFDLTEAQAAAKMCAIRAHLTTNFGFAFADLLTLRIDDTLFPPEMNVTLPFDAIDLFIYQITNSFADAVENVLGVMDDSGFLGAIDQSVFTEARASGAGLLAVPDMGYLMDLIGGFSGEPSPPTATSFLLSQMPDLEGPVAIAAAGYIGDQILSTTSDELKIFEDLLGKAPTTTVNGLDAGQSLVVAMFPPDVNVTGYSPEDEALNRTFHDSESNMIFWNATAYTSQPDYIISFEEGAFPPLITIHRTFSPATLTAGGTVTVSVGVHNEGVEPIYDVTLEDTSINDTYPTLAVSGTQTATSAVLNAGAWLNITYTVTFVNEGGYVFFPATVEYDFENQTYSKSTHTDGYTVSPDIAGLLTQMISDGWPYTGVMIGVVGLGAVFSIVRLARGRGGGGSYQV